MGAIAGGVVGGVAFVILIVLCVYFFWIKKRRAEQDAELEEDWANDELASQKRSTQFTAVGDAASTRTRGSLAASILSRASNIIQIAYIPGVTNRNGSAHTSIHAPVPPVPAAHRSQPPKSPLSNEGDMLFFRPGDLRGSTWSASSSNSDRRGTRYTMASISPSLMRDSIGSDIFMDDASSQPMPATAAARLAPRMVSVKSNTSSMSLSNASSGTLTPTPEASDKPKTLQVMMPGSGLSPSGSVRGQVKQVTVGGGKGRFPVRQVSDSSTTPSLSKHAPAVSSPLAERDDAEFGSSSSSSVRQSREASSLIQNIDFASPPTTQPLESPFFDASEQPTAAAAAAASSNRPNPYASMASTVGTDGLLKNRGKSIGSLSAVDEESLRRLSKISDVHEGDEDEVKRGHESPFTDEHAID